MSMVTLKVERDVPHHKDDTARRVIVTLPSSLPFTGRLLGVLPLTSIEGHGMQLQVNLDDSRHTQALRQLLTEFVQRSIERHLEQGERRFEVVVDGGAYERFVQRVRDWFSQD